MMPFSLPTSVTQDNVVQLEKEGLLNLAALRTIDCAGLKDFDSTVLTVLLAWQKKLQSDGQQITVQNAPEKLTVLAGVYGVSELLGLS
jgi:phospholipid transport system transporter-binding protein